MRLSLLLLIVLAVPSVGLSSKGMAQDFIYRLPDTTHEYDVSDGEGLLTLALSIDEDPDGAGFPNESDGFSMSIESDSEYLTPIEGRILSDLEDMNDGAGPNFVSVDAATGDAGFVVACVYDLFGAVTLVLSGQNLVELCWELNSDNLVDLTEAVETEITFSDDLAAGEGFPPVASVVAVLGFSYVPEFDGAVVTLQPVEGNDFLRGDADGNNDVFSILDAVFIFEWGFNNGAVPPCLDAADVDDDGSAFPILDGLYLLAWAFQMEDAPPDPGPTDCGRDPDGDDDGVTCETESTGCQ